MSTLCTLLTTPTLILYKTNNIIHIHKIIKLLYDRQCNTILFQDLYTNINTVKMLLERYSVDYTSQIANSNGNSSSNNSNGRYSNNSGNNSDSNISAVYNSIIQAMMNIVTFKTDIHINIHDLYTALVRIMTSIEAVVSNSGTSSSDSTGAGESGTGGGHNSDPLVDLPSVDPHGNIPNEFFINNEERFRGWYICALPY